MTATASLDVPALRRHFPALAGGTAHFDGPGGSQTPDVVADAVRDTMLSSIANRGSVTAAERTADAVVTGARAAMADLLGAEPSGIVFGRSMTELTFMTARTLAAGWGPGDEVVVSRLDHDANVRPWVLAAQAAGATVRWIDFDAGTGELTVADVAAVLSDRTRLVAVTGASNLIGTRPDLPAIAAAVHARGALLFVDGVHLTAHASIDVAALGADLYACSPYKFLGPHCGVLAGDVGLLETLHPDKLLPSSDAVPERFELGTLPYELLAGTRAAVDFLAQLPGVACAPDADRRARLAAGSAATEVHETRLRERLEAALAELPGVTVWSRAARRTPTLLMSFAGRDPGEAYRFLAARNVNAPAGTFYAYEPARVLALPPEGALRVGIAPYTDDDDVDRLIAGLTAFLGS